MNMNEFNEQSNKRGDDVSSILPGGRSIPPDFTEEDIDFARELNSFFNLESEETPPYFVQTLLESEESRFQAAPHGFEHKTRARVFRRLNLRHRLLASHRSSMELDLAAVTALNRLRGGRFSGLSHAVPARRPLLVLIAASLLFMLFTMAFTSQSFVEGVAVLLHGAHVGVYQVHAYPKGVRSFNNQNNGQSTQISLTAAQQRLHFSMYWPQVTPSDYQLDNINLYDNINLFAGSQPLIDGPLLELQYDYTAPGEVAHGSGEIAVLEFKISPGSVVDQVLGPGSNTFQTIFDVKGNVVAIYVDGQWVSLNRYSHRWVSGGRSELIYQRDGVVFWIVGDQRDGTGKNALLSVAQSLQVVNASYLMHVGVRMAVVTQLVNDSSGLFTGDIIAVGSDDSVDSPYLVRIGPDQPLQEKPIEKHGKRAAHHT